LGGRRYDRWRARRGNAHNPDRVRAGDFRSFALRRVHDRGTGFLDHVHGAAADNRAATCAGA